MKTPRGRATFEEETPVPEESLAFEGPAGRLAGTLSVPRSGGARGAVVILPGSGPVDRDGNSRRLRTNLYRDLARFVSARGFIALRYDKRGVGRSEGERLEPGLWDRVDDARAAVAYLRARLAALPIRPRSDCPIVLLGHSEGCIIATALNARVPVDGLLLLSGPCESLAETSPRQVDRALEELGRLTGLVGLIVRVLHLVERQRRRSKAIVSKLLATDRPWIRVSGVKINAKWIREHYAYDLARDLPEVHCPTLAITGEKDVQVLPEHARKIAESVSGPAAWHVVPGMTHLLRRTDEPVRMLSLLKLYRRQCREPIDAELLDRIGAWLDATFPKEQLSHGGSHAHFHDE